MEFQHHPWDAFRKNPGKNGLTTNSGQVLMLVIQYSIVWVSYYTQQIKHIIVVHPEFPGSASLKKYTIISMPTPRRVVPHYTKNPRNCHLPCISWILKNDPYMGVEPKIVVFTPQIIPFVHRVFHEIFTIHFGGKIPLFLVQHPTLNLQDGHHFFKSKGNHHQIWSNYKFTNLDFPEIAGDFPY